MRKKWILTLMAALLTGLAAHAVPALPGAFTYVQPDGSTVRLERHGDEFYSWTTLAGTSQVVFLDARGYWRPSSPKPEIAERARRRRQQANRERASAKPYPITHGPRHIPVFLVEFQDQAFSLDNPLERFDAMLNQEGYSANDATGSVRDYYKENSHDAFEPIFDVYGPILLPHEKAFYGEPVKDAEGNILDNDKNPQQVVYDACVLLDDSVDFSIYDYDQDGYVDMILYYYAGYNTAEGGSENAIWPHSWSVLSSGDAQVRGARFDGLRLDSYFCTSELKGNAGIRMCGIGTTCHEFGHSLGLPDFYDTDYEKNGQNGGLYSFSLMCSGNYNNGGNTPPYLNAEERILLGWMPPENLLELPEGPLTFRSVKENVAYKSLTDVDGEYYLYECRDGLGWDSPLPGGLLIYHVDKSQRMVEGISAANRWRNLYNINNIGNHPCFSLVPAGSTKNLYYRDGQMDEFVFPGSRFVRNYTSFDWDGNPAGCTVSDIAYSLVGVSLNTHYSFVRKVQGQVLGLDNAPLEGVYVGGGGAEAITGSDGSFLLALEGYTGSSVRLHFSKRGYQGTSMDVELAPRVTRLSVILHKKEEGAEWLYSYWTPDIDQYFVSLDVGESAFCAIQIPASDLPANGGRLLSISFPPYSTAEAYYLVAEEGDKRILTSQIPGLTRSMYGGFYTVNLTEKDIRFSGKEDLRVGFGIAVNASQQAGVLFTFGQNAQFYACELDPDAPEKTAEWELVSFYGYDPVSLVIDVEVCELNPDDQEEDPLSFAKLGIPAIADPGFGHYAAGDTFQLMVDLPEALEGTASEWACDGKELTGAKSFQLTAGVHTITCTLKYGEGSEETLELTVDVK